MDWWTSDIPWWGGIVKELGLLALGIAAGYMVSKKQAARDKDDAKDIAVQLRRIEKAESALSELRPKAAALHKFSAAARKGIDQYPTELPWYLHQPVLSPLVESVLAWYMANASALRVYGKGSQYEVDLAKAIERMEKLITDHRESKEKYVVSAIENVERLSAMHPEKDKDKRLPTDLIAMGVAGRELKAAESRSKVTDTLLIADYVVELRKLHALATEFGKWIDEALPGEPTSAENNLWDRMPEEALLPASRVNGIWTTSTPTGA